MLCKQVGFGLGFLKRFIALFGEDSIGCGEKSNCFYLECMCLYSYKYEALKGHKNYVKGDEKKK